MPNRLLIACHCVPSMPGHESDLHGEIHVRGGSFDSITYVDPFCKAAPNQYVHWEEIPTQSIHVIYGLHCPIYGIFFPATERAATLTAEEKGVLQSFNAEARRCLVPEGKLILPYRVEDADEKAEAFRILNRYMPQWTVRHQRDIGFSIQEADPEQSENPSYLVLTKSATVGGNRSRSRSRSRSRHHRRRTTRKHRR